MHTSKLRRAGKLLQILSKYGFEDLRSKLESKDSSKTKDTLDSEDILKSQQAEFYERIRKAIEELGPTYIKFGQTLSTREDLFPRELILELKKLQDDVPSEELNLIQFLKDELNINPEDHFSEIDSVPIASASIAQVYKATLQNGEQVILKIKRPGIKDIVQADLYLIKDIINLLTQYYKFVQEINLIHVFEAFSKSLFEELLFHNELKNIDHFRRNFKDEKHIVTMKAYPELSNDNVLCISYIEGFKINDITSLKANNLDTEKILDQCFHLFLDQILEHGFFHADPHPGNILVTPKSQIAFIDLGAMAKMLPKDKELLEDFIVYFINKDANRIIATLKRMALQIDIVNEKLLERALHELLDIVSTQSLSEIDVKALFTNFSHILNQNNIIMPEHIYLLVKGIVLMEGIGRELNPHINIIDKVKPYIAKIALNRLQPKHLLENSIGSLWELRRIISAAPENFTNLINKVNEGDFKISVESKDFSNYRKEQMRNNSMNRILALACVTFLGACLLSGIDQTTFWGLPILSWILFLVSILMILFLWIKKMKLPE